MRIVIPAEASRKFLPFVLSIFVVLSPILAVAAETGIGPSTCDLQCGTEAISDWNQTLIQTAVAEDGLLTLKGVRTAAMMHIAMHDALNAIERRYSGYAYQGQEPLADPLVAVAQAGYSVFVSQYPDQQEVLQKKLGRWLDLADSGEGKALGRALGSVSAEAILAAREGDGWDDEAEYRWHPMGPGVYAEFHEHSGTPEGFVFGSGWAAARPFMLNSADQMRSPPPPHIESDAYVRAFNEVKEVGRYESSQRTPDQSQLAMWWKDFAENSHNRLARKLLVEEQIDAWSSARLFALVNMSIFDGYVSVFENKFYYNHWRPYTAIRWAANDGNPATVPDPDWNNLHQHTYAFPTYPSAHGVVCAAAMTVLADTFGENLSFTMYTPEVDSAGPMSAKLELDPATRSFESFSDAAMECAMSRVYLGIHFRYDSIEGNKLGNQIGQFALLNYLTPLSQNSYPP